jgi:hypothetical protein
VIERALSRSGALGLDWHAAQTTFLAQAAGRL